MARAAKSGSLQGTLDSRLKTLPALVLARVLLPKLKSFGVKSPKAVAEKLSAHILSGSKENFNWPEGSYNGRLVSIELTDSDLSEIDRIAEQFQASAPDMVSRMVDQMSRSMASKFISEWERCRWHEERDLRSFRDNLEDRWWPALLPLKVMMEVSRQHGESIALSQQQAKKRKNLQLTGALIRLHLRGCQVCAEIVTLLENGFADGAMARWRTLHEIATVGLVLTDGGDVLAERYLAHEIVESKKALDRYILDHDKLGYPPISATDQARVNKLYAAVITRFGADFKTDYGWASEYLSNNRPTFYDIEDSAGRAMMHSHYKMASYNVRAGSKALTSRMGGIDPTMLIAGMSNAGLADPGQLTAHTFAIINSLLPLHDVQMMDNLVQMAVFIRLRDQAVREFGKIENEIKRQEWEIERAIGTIAI